MFVTAVTVTIGLIAHTLLETTIFATREMREQIQMIDFTLMILFGMEQVVGLAALAVSSTTHPGSVRPFHSPSLMTWRSG